MYKHDTLDILLNLLSKDDVKTFYYQHFIPKYNEKYLYRLDTNNLEDYINNRDLFFNRYVHLYFLRKVK